MIKLLNSRSKSENFFILLKGILGFSPKNTTYYRRAFTHRSMQEKDRFGKPLNYERLEFLGDAILDSIVSAYLFEQLPEADEGYLTKMRSKIVSRQTLNTIGRDFELVNLMKADEHLDQFGDNVHGDLFEALIGAIFEDRGYEYCKRFIYRKLIADYVDIERLESKILSYKSLLIEWCQKEKKIIEFDDREDTGNETVKHFSTRLFISGRLVAKARSTSKKKAEEKASRRAYYSLKAQIPLPN